MPRCGCADACSCLITAGEGISVEGIGTIENPYEITSESSDLTGRVEFTDEGNVDFTATGVGTLNDPLTVFADAVLAVADLTDVSDTAPNDGDVLVWRLDHWENEQQTGSGTGLPSGGADGQVLTKQSATDGDADWETPAAGGSGGAVLEPTYSTSRRQAAVVPAANNTQVVIPWDTLDYADGITCDAAGIFTFPVAGHYQVNAKVAFSSNNTGKREIRALLNGASAVPGIVLIPPVTSASGTNVQFSRLLKVAAGDTLQIGATQTSGVTLDAASAGVAYNSIDITKVPTLSPGGGGVVVERPIATSRQHATPINSANNTLIQIPWDTAQADDGSIPCSSGVFTIPADGWYQVNAKVTFNANTTGMRQLRISRNGASLDLGTVQVATAIGGNATTVQYARALKLAAGDVLLVSAQQTSGGALDVAYGGIAYNSIDITKMPQSFSGSAVSTYGERNYSSSRRQLAAVSLVNNTQTIVPWDTEDFTDGIPFAAGIFTIPVTGYYHVNVGLALGSGATAGVLQTRLFVNGATNALGQYGWVASNGNSSTINRTLKLNAGDVVQVNALQNGGSTQATSTSSGYNFVNITKVPAPVINGAAASGVWGVAPLDATTYGTDSLVGLPVYIDTAGQLRAQPRLIPSKLPTVLAPAYPTGTSVMYLGAADGATWPTGTNGIVVTHRTANNVIVQQCSPFTSVSTRMWVRNGTSTAWGPWVLVADSTANPRVSRLKSASQTLTTPQTYYNLTYETTEEADSGITYAAGVFTFTTPGVYQVNATQHFASTAADPQLRLSFMVNGVNYGYAVSGGTSPSNSQSLAFSRSWRFAAGDTLTIQAFSTSASQVAYGSASSRYSFIDITKIAS